MTDRLKIVDELMARYNAQDADGYVALMTDAAVEAGYTPQTPVVDQPITIGNWSPRNYSGTFSGNMTLAQAVAQSTNTVAASVADQVGRDSVARAARRLGVTSRIGLEPGHFPDFV